MSSLREGVLEYLELRRSLGFRLKLDERLLLDFCDFMERRHATHITAKLAATWAQRPASTNANYHAGRLRAVRSFARHRVLSDPRTEVPAADLLPRQRSAFQPHIFSQEDIRRILTESLWRRGGAKWIVYQGRYTIIVLAGGATEIGVECAVTELGCGHRETDIFAAADLAGADPAASQFDTAR